MPQGAIEEELQRGLRRGEHLAKSLHSDAQDGLVGILASGRDEHAGRRSLGSRDLRGALCRAHSCRIAVEYEHQLLRARFRHQLEVFVRQRGTAGGEGRQHARLVQADGVEVSLDE